MKTYADGVIEGRRQAAGVCDQILLEDPVGRFGLMETRNAILALPAPKEAEPVPAEQREPVAWVQKHKGGNNLVWEPIRRDSSYTYEPLYAAPPANAEIREKYLELLYAVEKAHPNESRHETALRYIRQAETRPAQCSQAAMKEPK
jgi:hypothetical protein